MKNAAIAHSGLVALVCCSSFAFYCVRAHANPFPTHFTGPHPVHATSPQSTAPQPPANQPPKPAAIVPQQATTPPKPPKPALKSSSAAATFKTDVADLNSTLDRYLKGGNRLDLALTAVITGMDTVAVMNSDLSGIQQDAVLLRDLLGLAKQVESVKEPASLMLTALERTDPPVKQALKATNDANKKFISLRNKLNTIDKAVRQAVSATEKLEKGLSIYSATLYKAQQCTDALQDGNTKTTLQGYIDNGVQQFDPSVVRANRELVKPLNEMNAMEQDIQRELKDLLDDLHKLEQDLTKLHHNLGTLINPLHDLGSLLKKEFSTEFPYPAPTISDPFKMKHYKISVNFKTIMQGERAVEKEIEKVLSKELYKAAKLFGIGKLFKTLENDASKELNSIKNRLNMSFAVDVPGLDQLDAKLAAFEAAVTRLPEPDIEVASLENLLNGITTEWPKLNAAISVCSR